MSLFNPKKVEIPSPEDFLNSKELKNYRIKAYNSVINDIFLSLKQSMRTKEDVVYVYSNNHFQNAAQEDVHKDLVAKGWFLVKSKDRAGYWISMSPITAEILEKVEYNGW